MMKTTGIQVFKKLHILVGVLLYSILSLAVHPDLKAAPTVPVDHQHLTHPTKEQHLQFLADDATPGKAKAIRQLNKSLLTPLFYTLLLPLYPQLQDTSPALQTLSATNTDCGLYSIQIKGP
ncbi:hypothetical protein OB13_06330 [Pontibacter sp. HJ8]